MNKKTERLLLCTVIIIFLALRIAFITQKNLWFDEVFSWHLTLGSFHDIIVRTSLDIHPPLYYFILKIWTNIFSDSIFAMRFLSTLFSALSLLFIYPLSKRILSPVISIMVLLFFSVNPLNIFYSQEARMSAMNLFLNSGSVYFLLTMLGKARRWNEYFKQRDVYLYILFRTLALYTHYFSFFIFAAEIIIILLRPGVLGRIKVCLASLSAIFLLYLPWIPTFVQHLSRGQSWRYEQITHSGLTELLNFIKDTNLGLYYHYTELNIVYYITIFLVFVYLYSLIISFPRPPSKSSPSEVRIGSMLTSTSLIPFLLVFVPIAIAMVITFNQKIEFYRYLSIIVPYVIIFIVYGITKLKKTYLVIPILLILMIINIFGLSVQYSFDFKNDDYRPLIKHIESNFIAGDRIYVEPHYMGWSIDYYKKQWNLNLPNPVYIHYGWNEILDSIKVQNPERFWVVLDYSAVDTVKYSEYITGLMNKLKIDEKNTYYLAPAKVELYRFNKY